MTDEELVKHCMCGCMYLEAECPNCNKVTDADRIEELEWLRDALVKKVQGLTNLLDDQFGTPCEQIRHKQEIEALTEQLEAARADAKEAEGYAEELEKEIELNEQEACMLENDLIKADKEIDNLKVKLAKAVEGLNYCINAPFSGWTIAQGYARATLAEIESSEAVTLEGEKG
jgi:predicted RNase H-like nuclease (RuvC/YqgF family)